MFLILISTLILTVRASFKPVIMMHGVGSGAGEMNTIERLLKERDNSTLVTSLPLYEGQPNSWDHNLQEQVDGVIDAVKNLIAENPEAYADGYHFVCKSQGAVTCRAVIESWSYHNVRNFVSLAGPQSGVYGRAYFESLKYLPKWLVGTTTEEIYLVAYKSLGQDISVGNLWRDPNHLQDFLDKNNFIPKYTEKATEDMKSNFLKLKKAVFCVGSGHAYDGGIEPWQTGVFGSVVDGKMLNMTQRDFYLNDQFGLKTLDESGRLELTIVPDVSHNDWTGNEDVIRKYVLPHCT